MAALGPVFLVGSAIPRSDCLIRQPRFGMCNVTSNVGVLVTYGMLIYRWTITQ